MDAPTSEETPDKAAQYIASMTHELAELARRNGLETLSQILEMARLEADRDVLGHREVGSMRDLL